MFGKNKQVLLQIKEGSIGLETFISDNLRNINVAYKDQFIAFLENVIEQIKPESAKKKK